MRTSLNTLLTVLVVGGLLLTGCSKDDDKPEPSSDAGGLTLGGGTGGGGTGGGGGGQSTVQLLCDKDYKLTASTVSPAFQGTTNYFSLLQSCNTDDILRFAQAGTFTWDEGPTMCQGVTQQTVSGTWALSNNNSTLTLTVGGAQVVWTVVAIDGNILKVSWQGNDTQGNTYTITDTWTKQ